MPYLPETLASIEGQTYRNWEILAWDNGSTDGTVAELLRWIPERLPGRVVTDRPRLTVGDSLRQMVRECGTELCARIDADDVNFPERLERQVAFLLAHPEVALVGAQMIEIDQRGRVGSLVGPFATTHNRMVCQLLYIPGIPHNAVLFRRSAILQAGNYRDIANVEDYDLWLRLAVNHKLANLEEALVYYRIHEQSATVVARKKGVLEQMLNDRFVELGPALFGCTPEEARALVEKRHPFPIVPLVRIARRLARRSGESLLSTLRTREFLNGARRLSGSRSIADALSHLALSALDPDPGTLRRELYVLARAGTIRMGVRNRPAVASGSAERSDDHGRR